MVDRRMRVLLALLAAAVGTAGVALAAGEALGRLAAARASADRSEDRIELLRTAARDGDVGPGVREEIAADIAERRARFYRSDDMNPYSFGNLVKDRLSSLGISVLRYQVVEVEGVPLVEFTASGSARSFVAFFREVSRSAKAWTVPTVSLTMREGTEVTDAFIRVGYVADDATSR
jgi:hypothetical protein